MAWRKLYIGDQGPFYYDDEVLVDDPDGDFPGETQHAILTAGGLKIGGVEYATRLVDALTNVTVNTSTVTVVTGVDFGAETVTTEDITFVTGVNLTVETIRVFET